jgi:hypothetical protein
LSFEEAPEHFLALRAVSEANSQNIVASKEIWEKGERLSIMSPRMNENIAEALQIIK